MKETTHIFNTRTSITSTSILTLNFCIFCSFLVIIKGSTIRVWEATTNTLLRIIVWQSLHLSPTRSVTYFNIHLSVLIIDFSRIKLRGTSLVVSFYFLQWLIWNSLIADFLIQSILFYYSHFYCSGLLTKMLAKLPVEIVLLICEYPELKDLGQLAWTNKRIMQIIRKYLPKALEKEILFYRRKIFLVWAEINSSS